MHVCRYLHLLAGLAVVTRATVFPATDVGRLALFMKTLSEPARLAVVLALTEECRPVSNVVAATGLSQPSVSHHLRILRDAGVARPDRRGAFVYY